MTGIVFVNDTIYADTSSWLIKKDGSYEKQTHKKILLGQKIFRNWSGSFMFSLAGNSSFTSTVANWTHKIPKFFITKVSVEKELRSAVIETLDASIIMIDNFSVKLVDIEKIFNIGKYVFQSTKVKECNLDKDEFVTLGTGAPYLYDYLNGKENINRVTIQEAFDYAQKFEKSYCNNIITSFNREDVF